jgi:hypothetical protein
MVSLPRRPQLILHISTGVSKRWESNWELVHCDEEVLKISVTDHCLYCQCITSEKWFSLIQNLDSMRMGSLAVV